MFSPVEPSDDYSIIHHVTISAQKTLSENHQLSPVNPQKPEREGYIVILSY